MTFTEAQLLLCLARAQRQHAEIVSGAYKFKETQVGYEVPADKRCGYELGPGCYCAKYKGHEEVKAALREEGKAALGISEHSVLAFRYMTDAEKLKDSLMTLDAHLQFAQECVDYIGEQKEKKS